MRKVLDRDPVVDSALARRLAALCFIAGWLTLAVAMCWPPT
jgi:hypothetical protein